jgi:hypothetical protein
VKKISRELAIERIGECMMWFAPDDLVRMVTEGFEGLTYLDLSDLQEFYDAYVTTNMSEQLAGSLGYLADDEDVIIVEDAAEADGESGWVAEDASDWEDEDWDVPWHEGEELARAWEEAQEAGSEEPHGPHKAFHGFEVVESTDQLDLLAQRLEQVVKDRPQLQVTCPVARS